MTKVLSCRLLTKTGRLINSSTLSTPHCIFARSFNCCCFTDLASAYPSSFAYCTSILAEQEFRQVMTRKNKRKYQALKQVEELPAKGKKQQRLGCGATSRRRAASRRKCEGDDESFRRMIEGAHMRLWF